MSPDHAEGAALGAPGALQVADRFHVLQNLGQAVEKCVAAHRDCLRAVNPQTDNEAAEVDVDASLAETEREDPPALPTGRRAERMPAHHALVHGLLSEGMGLRAIARHLGWGRHTVQRYARAARWQDIPQSRQPPRCAPRLPATTRRRDRRHDHYHRTACGTRRARVACALQQPAGLGPQAAAVARRSRPSSRGAVRPYRGRLDHPDTLTEDEKRQLKAVLAACPELECAEQLVRDFAQMPTTRTGTDLPEWINSARGAKLPGITGFARGLTHDLEAVVAGLSLHWSSGGVEGAVNRTKKVKRQLYGRAGFELLRKMILLQ